MVFLFYRQYGIIYALKRTRIAIVLKSFFFGIFIDMEENLISLAIALFGALAIFVAFEAYIGF